jgi:methyl-accepting chemotaxis protein
MLHASAEEYCKSRGMTFHRIDFGSGSLTEFERSALKAFSEDPSLETRVQDAPDAQGRSSLYVLAPARLQEECNTCHGGYGLDLFKDRKVGDLVAACGFSMFKEELVRDERNMRLAGLGAGIGVLLLISLIITYFVRRVILRPLAGLSGSIIQMAGGDLTVRAEILSEDEVGRLAGAFNAMVVELNLAILTVEMASEQVASGSEELAANAEQMARIVEENAKTGTTLQGAGRSVQESMRWLWAPIALAPTSNTSRMSGAASPRFPGGSRTSRP